MAYRSPAEEWQEERARVEARQRAAGERAQRRLEGRKHRPWLRKLGEWLIQLAG